MYRDEICDSIFDAVGQTLQINYIPDNLWFDAIKVLIFLNYEFYTVVLSQID
jgi:hypothetical protein